MKSFLPSPSKAADAAPKQPLPPCFTNHWISSAELSVASGGRKPLNAFVAATTSEGGIRDRQASSENALVLSNVKTRTINFFIASIHTLSTTHRRNQRKTIARIEWRLRRNNRVVDRHCNRCAPRGELRVACSELIECIADQCVAGQVQREAIRAAPARGGAVAVDLDIHKIKQAVMEGIALSSMTRLHRISQPRPGHPWPVVRNRAKAVLRKRDLSPTERVHCNRPSDITRMRGIAGVLVPDRVTDAGGECGVVSTAAYQFAQGGAALRE